MELYKHGELEDLEAAEDIFLRTVGSYIELPADEIADKHEVNQADVSADEPVPENTDGSYIYDDDCINEATVILMKLYRLRGDISHLMGYAMRAAVTAPSAEMCCELGQHFEELYEKSDRKNPHDKAEALMWYHNALHETESILDIRSSGEIPQAAIERLDR